MDAGNKRPIDASAVAALTEHSTLRRLSLFAGQIGDDGMACIVRRASKDCWPALRHLDVGACCLSLASVQQLANALLAGTLLALQVCCAAQHAAAALEKPVATVKCAVQALCIAQEMVIAGNPAVKEEDNLQEVLSALREGRPELDVPWRGM